MIAVASDPRVDAAGGGPERRRILENRDIVALGSV
jgi:hypothetical protein